MAEQGLLLVLHRPLEVGDVGVHDVRAGLAGQQGEGGAATHQGAGGQPQAGALLAPHVRLEADSVVVVVIVVVVERQPRLDVNSLLITLSVIAC